eukprot:gnl/MRDRNA2_/MRDRNA2_207741_c0_seq1.p1 gnl/MRDRNA2_/MRDRNA2_207741_c0~~gnl/MRDRNA2_/MRDRNA2_207741_c0_seq1.p1  ORF type:complete len:165 (+),score=21.96 gnl/MRDRNA2_/MRDRNA2_207741_c0_seq1:1-495(+)
MVPTEGQHYSSQGPTQLHKQAIPASLQTQAVSAAAQAGLRPCQSAASRYIGTSPTTPPSTGQRSQILQQTPARPAGPPNAGTVWVIEEVVDFGPPVDELGHFGDCQFVPTYPRPSVFSDCMKDCHDRNCQMERLDSTPRSSASTPLSQGKSKVQVSSKQFHVEV